MSGHLGASERADALRQAFDRSFTRAPNAETDTATVENLLAVRVGSQSCVLRLAEVSALCADKKVTWLPSSSAALLGIAGLRGTVLPIYDLGMLLGWPKAAAPRWLLVTAVTPVGLAFDAFDGYLSVPSEAIVPEAGAEAHARHVRDVVRTVDLVRPLVSLSSVLESIKHRPSQDGAERER